MTETHELREGDIVRTKTGALAVVQGMASNGFLCLLREGFNEILTDGYAKPCDLELCGHTDLLEELHELLREEIAE